MKLLYAEVAGTILFVLIATKIFYDRLINIDVFWSQQSIWSIGLILCWIVVALGYVHQGWVVRRAKSAKNVSAVLPIAVFIVQCILFVKGVHYHDWSLIVGAIIVNSGVTFSLFQIYRTRSKK